LTRLSAAFFAAVSLAAAGTACTPIEERHANAGNVLHALGLRSVTVTEAGIEHSLSCTKGWSPNVTFTAINGYGQTVEGLVCHRMGGTQYVQVWEVR